MTPELTNPLWLRVWHWVQALVFFGLIATGLSMHYMGSAWVAIPFPIAVQVHNACGIATAALWMVFVIYSVASGHIRYYVPDDLHIIHSAVIQVRYYVAGMFRGDPPPVKPGLRNNPAQQISYAIVMYLIMPVSIGSGVLLLFPILAPERALGQAGLWPMTVLHLAAGYLLTLFLVVHIYLATTGETLTSLTREMITGRRGTEEKSGR